MAQLNINPNTELGTIETTEDLDLAIKIQLKAHGMTDKEIDQWFKEAETQDTSDVLE